MEEQEFSGTLASDLCDSFASFSCLVSSGRQDQNITYLADIPPDTARCNGNSRLWNWNDSILSRYWSPGDGVRRSDFDDISDGGYHQLTYGEVTPLGVRQLAFEMGIANCDGRDDRTRLVDDDRNNEKREIVFYDLGSGVGRLVTQMYIDQPNRVAKAVGIEFAEDRHTIGTMALGGIIAEEQYIAENFHMTSKYHEDIKDNRVTSEQFPIQLIHGDAIEVDFDPATTHVFISSLCFPENTLLAIQEKLLRLPNIRAVAALNRLDLIHQPSGIQWEERNASIQMSWGDSMAKIYLKVP